MSSLSLQQATIAAPLWWLFTLPLAAYLLWLSRKSYARLAPTARWCALAFRSLILLLLLAALSRPTFLTRSSSKQVVFLLDVSKSVSTENLEAALKAIDHVIQQSNGRRVQFALIAFGADAQRVIAPNVKWSSVPEDVRLQILYRQSLETLNARRAELVGVEDSKDAEELALINGQIADVTRFRDQIAGDHTAFPQAMRLAVASGSQTLSRTIYLMTDGNFNRGNWEESCAAARSDGVQLNVVRLDRPHPEEVSVASVVVPQNARINEGFSARVRLASSVATRGEVAVFKDGFLVQRRAIDIAKGENTVEIDGLFFREKGFHRVEATVQADRDTQVENNRGYSIVNVPGPVRVLYVDKDDSQIPYLKNALELEGMQVDARPAAGVPEDLAELLSFDAFVLSNVPAEHLTSAQMRMIRSYVEDFGGGFMMLGGDESFGLGGYYETPIEDVLPVRMPIKKDVTRPALALVMVIDKSGSMEGAKIQLAKRAALASAEVINPRDQVGVVGFDSASKVILDLTSAADRGTISSQIANLEAGGGTFLCPAMEDARQRLETTNARRKHVIVLSDGQTEGQGYEELAVGMAADGITISTVGIGDDADMRLLEAIATAGGGRSYFTNDFHRIPQIFTRETLRASKSMLVERLVQPSVVASDVSLKEINVEDLPPLLGYVATTAKPTAVTIIVSDNGDPILAKWRYGLGHTVAFTSETKPRWAEDWLDWPDFAKFWSQLVRSITINGLGRTIGVDASHESTDEGVRLTADIRDPTGGFLDAVTVSCTLISPNGQTNERIVDHTGAGLFETRVDSILYGRPQHLVWKVSREGEEAMPTPYGYVYSFSPEFSTTAVDSATLDLIAERTDGESMAVDECKLMLADTVSRKRVVLWPYLLAVALLLMPVDILIRRVG